MKSKKEDTRRKAHKIPDLKFEAKSAMTRFAGLVIFQQLFQSLKLKAAFTQCFKHLDSSASFRYGTIYLLLVVQILLGFRRLRGLDFLRGDPLVKRVVGLWKLPDVSTLSRMLSGADPRAVDGIRTLSRDLVLNRLESEKFRVVTLDFDGTVQSTKGHAEGTAVGFNKKKKGARGYYPLLCTIAQSGQVLDVHNRPGNVHDSNGALQFVKECLNAVRGRSPRVRAETRIDSAFFQAALLDYLEDHGVEFTCSVPFNRFTELKGLVEGVTDWERVNETWSAAPVNWKPKKWHTKHRMVIFRKRRKKQQKGSLQLDLFEPREYEYEYKVVVTNKTGCSRTILHFHNGRGSQEKIIGDCKQYAALDVVATRTRVGNQLFTLAGLIAHNLTRELQMRAKPKTRSTCPKRPAHWEFESLGNFRQRLLHRAGRLTRPARRLTLRIGAGAAARKDIESYVAAAKAT